MKTVIIDGISVCDRECLHSIFVKELDLPEYYGKNLDALHDCLSDLHSDVCITIRNLADLEQNIGKYADSLVRMLLDSKRGNDHITLMFD